MIEKSSNLKMVIYAKTEKEKFTPLNGKFSVSQKKKKETQIYERIFEEMMQFQRNTLNSAFLFFSKKRKYYLYAEMLIAFCNHSFIQKKSPNFFV